MKAAKNTLGFWAVKEEVEADLLHVLLSLNHFFLVSWMVFLIQPMLQVIISWVKRTMKLMVLILLLSCRCLMSEGTRMKEAAITLPCPPTSNQSQLRAVFTRRCS